MINITYDLLRNTAPCLNQSTCLDICLKQQITYTYEFVWFFIIGWIFSQMPYIILSIKHKDFTPELKTRLMVGFKLSGYLLNLAGVLYFLLVVL